MLSAGPISPEERHWANDKRVEEHADLARLRGGAAIPLTLGASWTGAATLDAGTRDHAQASIGFAAVFMWGEFLICRPAKRSVGLEGESVTRETTRFPGGAHLWGSRAGRRSRVWRWGWESRSPCCRAQRLWLELRAQFESQVPDPQREHLPAFLSPGRMAAPPIRVLLTVFLGEDRFTGTTMQRQRDHVAGRERLLWQVGEDQFVDPPRTCLSP